MDDKKLTLEDVLRLINEKKLFSEYNKTSNQLHKDFGIHSAELSLLLTYYLYVKEDVKEDEKNDGSGGDPEKD